MPAMETDTDFDRALIAAAFGLAEERGWEEVTVTRAARQGGLPLDRARGRFLGRGMILSRFGLMADQLALAGAVQTGDTRDRLFDLVMRRFDVLQAHRGGVLALRSFLPRHPDTALMLAAAHGVSMAFLLEAAGVPATGLRGALRVQGLLALWLRAARAWERDESADLAATMAAVDKSLDRLVGLERRLGWSRDGNTGPMDPPGGDLADGNLSGEVAPDLGASDLSASDLSGSDLSGSDLSGSDLGGAEAGGVTAPDLIPDSTLSESSFVERPISEPPPPADPPASPPV